MAIIKVKYIKLYYLVRLMLDNGLRISEVLNIRYQDITPTGIIGLRASKGSKNRTIHGGECKEFLLQCRTNKFNPFQDFDRYHVYREFKRYGIGTQLHGRKKRSITHSLRHIASKGIKEQGLDIEFSKSLLGHKSINSTKYYHE